jgi:hypothetical protein
MKLFKSKMFWIIAVVAAVFLFKDKPFMKPVMDFFKGIFSKKVAPTQSAGADPLTTTDQQ